MNTYTWYRGQLTSGLQLVEDDRLGPVVLLGENGRGRWYERVALDRHNPAEVVERGLVLEADPRKITLPAREGKEEKSFFVLRRQSEPSTSVLVRICTAWIYTRGTGGYWSTVEGEPETLVKGYGAHGLAGRLGSWNDGLVVIHPGDVLRIQPEGGHKVVVYALWLDERGEPRTLTWREYETLQAAEAAKKAVSGGQPLEVVFEALPCYTYTFFSASLREGLQVSGGTTTGTPVVVLGEHGRGRVLTEVPVVGANPGESVTSASVVVLSNRQHHGLASGETHQRIYGLAQSGRAGFGGAILVLVAPWCPRRDWLRILPIRGEPLLLAMGRVGGGSAGVASSAEHALYVLRPGEVLVIRGVYDDTYRVIENRDGQAYSAPWMEWEIADGKADP